MNGVINFNGRQACILMIGLVFFSCHNSTRKPEGILSHEDMVKMLSEVYLTEERISRLSLSPDSARRVFELIEHRLYEKTGIPDSVFKRSVDYYMDRPIEMEKIYSVLVDSLHLKEQRANYRPDQQ